MCMLFYVVIFDDDWNNPISLIYNMKYIEDCRYDRIIVNLL